MVKYSKKRGRFTTRSRNKRVRRYRTKILYGGVDYTLDFIYNKMTYRIVLNDNRYQLEENDITVIENCALTEFIAKLFQFSRTEVHRNIIDNIYNELGLIYEQYNFRSLFNRLKEIKQNNGDIPLSKINPDLSSFITDKSIILGEGVFGKVYEVFIDGKKYALKVTNEATKKLINQEITQYNTISELVCTDQTTDSFCSFISAYYDSSQRKIYILMEYCGNSLYDVIMSKIKSGGDIDKLITENTKKNIYTWLLNIAKGLKCMHKNEYAHLDIKPNNIVLDENLNSKLIDFGLILHINDENISSRGSIYYLPPEMIVVDFVSYVNIKGEGLLKCDIYSLGITFIECIYALTHPDIYKNTWDSIVFNSILRLDPKEKIEGDPKKIRLLLIEPDKKETVKVTMTKKLKELYTIQTLYDNIIDIHAKYPLFQDMIKINPNERCSIDDIITKCVNELAQLTSISS